MDYHKMRALFGEEFADRRISIDMIRGVKPEFDSHIGVMRLWDSIGEQLNYGKKNNGNGNRDR